MRVLRLRSTDWKLSLSQYENNIWREHFRISKQTFRFVCDLVSPHLARQDTNMRRAIPVEKRVAVALWRLATGNSYRGTGLVFGVGGCTAMNLKDEFCSALPMSANDFIKFPKGEAETRRAIEAFPIPLFPKWLVPLTDHIYRLLRQKTTLMTITIGSSSIVLFYKV